MSNREGKLMWSQFIRSATGKSFKLVTTIHHQSFSVVRYKVNHKADIDAAFGDREQKRKVRAWRWHTAAEILRGKSWRQPNVEFVARQ